MATNDTRIVDLIGTEIEHLVGAALLEQNDPNPGLVSIRAFVAAPIIAIAHLRPAQARQIAGQLLDAAARAEYEGDFFTAARTAGWPNDLVGSVAHLVRQGEIKRCDFGGR